MSQIIKIENYNPKWESEFCKLQAVIETAMEQLILSIEHVGSTSVKGLGAKPILDIYTSDLIHRQILVVRDKKRRKKSEVGKRHVRLFLPGRRAYPPSSFSISPPSNHATMSKY